MRSKCLRYNCSSDLVFTVIVYKSVDDAVLFLKTKFNFSEKVAVTHIDLELEADFENENLKGFVDLSVTKIDETYDHIVWYWL